GMAAVMLMGSNEPGRLLDWSVALLLAWGATAAILMSATLLYKVLGARALTALERLMGMLLVALSVQLLLDGIAAYLASLVYPLDLRSRACCAATRLSCCGHIRDLTC